MHSLAFLSLDKQTVNTDVVLFLQVLIVEDSRVFSQVRIIRGRLLFLLIFSRLT